MPVAGNKAQNLALGVNLGWIQQGAAYGGLPPSEMTADLERIRNRAGVAGYNNFSGYIDVALGKLSPVRPRRVLFQKSTRSSVSSKARRQARQPRHWVSGINLGRLQQGARANNRPTSLAIDDFNRVKQHAPLAGYHGYEGYVKAALSKLRSGQPTSAIGSDEDSWVSCSGNIRGRNEY